MKVKLVVEKGSKKTRAVTLHKANNVVGRMHGCDLRIPSSEVSRRHCVLRMENGYLTVEDLKSCNGTFLNGTAVNGREVVRPGDRLSVGPVTFVVEYQLTPEAIDRLLRGDVSGGEELAEVEPLPEVEPLEEKLPTAEDEDLVFEVEDAPIPMDDPEGWQLPETDELRDILTGLEDDEPPPQKRRKK